MNQIRTALLQDELERFVQIAAEQLKPCQVFLFGSLAQGNVDEWSDLDLVVITETDLPFYERGRQILKQMRPRVGMDLLVYTPEEWQEMKQKPFIRDEVLGKGKVIYEQ